jgi:uncharacterized protein
MKKYIIFAFSIVIFFILGSCNSKNTDITDNFDRTQMLKNYADNLIVPAFTNLQTNTNTLKQATDDFVANPTSSKLGIVQDAWLATQKSWQYACPYNFGAAGEEGVRKTLAEEIATFPVSSSKIEANISSNTLTLSDFSRDNRGLLAIEYLVFDPTKINDAIVANFNTNRKNYLQAVVNKIKTQVDAVVTDWKGNYYNDFLKNNGTEAGSSTASLYNEFLKSYENLKNFKLAIPLGKRVGQTQAEPTKVEAYYSAKSLEMMKLHFQVLENLWLGKNANGQDGTGFKEYLESIQGGQTLVASTENQINSIKNALNTVPNSPEMAKQIQNGQIITLETVYNEFQKHTRYFKSDMSSLLGIAITFSSGDGD